MRIDGSKKISGLVVALALALFFQDGSAGTPHRTDNPAVSCSEPEQVTDYLMKIEYSSWDEELAMEISSLLRVDDDAVSTGGSVAGCTSVRKDGFVGRNFDWNYTDMSEYFVRVSGNEKGRHASIGVATLILPDNAFEMIPLDPLAVLPMFTMDGVNDRGVSANINIVEGGSAGNTTGTCPGGDPLCVGYVVRYVLDNADSAAHAVDLLKQRDIFAVDLGGRIVEAHFMISDPKETYIVECVSNSLVVVKAPDGKPAAMSNFHVACSPHASEYETVYDPDDRIRMEYTALSEGIERYDRALAGIDTVDSMDGIFVRCTNNWYRQAFAVGNERAWWSEMNGTVVLDENAKPLHVFTYYDGPEFDDLRMQYFAASREMFKEVLDNEAKGYGRVSDRPEETPDIWQTVHTSVYDLTAKVMRLYVQEIPVPYEFRLNEVVEPVGERDVILPIDVSRAAMTLRGVVLDGTGALAGTLELKLAKANRKKRVSKVSGSFTPTGGKRISLKAVNMQGYDFSAGPQKAEFVVKGYGTMTLKIGSGQMGAAFSGIIDGGYAVSSATVGGEVVKTAQFSLPEGFADRIDGFPVVVELSTDLSLLPEKEPVQMKGRKWTTAKAATVKYAKSRKSGGYDWVINNGKDDLKKTNLSGLKLTYTAKTGVFKGSFKAYTLNASGKAPKLRSVSVAVSGVVVEGRGYGKATIKRSSASFPVMIE